jgi:hypothetical protein
MRSMRALETKKLALKAAAARGEGRRLPAPVRAVPGPVLVMAVRA